MNLLHNYILQIIILCKLFFSFYFVSFFSNIRAYTHGYILKICVPLKFIFWNLMLNAMVLGGWVFGKCLGHGGGTSWIETP